MFPPEHLISALGQSRFVRQTDEQAHGLLGDSLFGIVEVQAFGLDAKELPAFRVLREQAAQIRGID